jgi:hypothetical protein
MIRVEIANSHAAVGNIRFFPVQRTQQNKTVPYMHSTHPWHDMSCLCRQIAAALPVAFLRNFSCFIRFIVSTIRATTM